MVKRYNAQFILFANLSKKLSRENCIQNFLVNIQNNFFYMSKKQKLTKFPWEVNSRCCEDFDKTNFVPLS